MGSRQHCYQVLTTAKILRSTSENLCKNLTLKLVKESPKNFYLAKNDFSHLPGTKEIHFSNYFLCFSGFLQQQKYFVCEADTIVKVILQIYSYNNNHTISSEVQENITHSHSHFLSFLYSCE